MKRASVFARPRRDSRSETISKENETVGPPGKKRKLVSRDALGNSLSEAKVSTREALCSLNAHVEPSLPQVANELTSSLQVNGQGDWEENRMATAEVEALLSTKILGNSKFDLKGKNAQMTEHIKKLRACIRQFLQIETAYVLQLEQLQCQIQEEKKSREVSESAMKCKQDELESRLSELRLRCTTLEAELAGAKEEKQELLLACERDATALQIAQKEQQQLLDDVEKIKKDSAIANDQVKSLQDINKRLTEYNTSLQVYNTKLQRDATSATEENTKTQQEKITILETLSAVRGNAAALQTQLDTAKFQIQEETKQRNSLLKELEHLRGILNITMEERDHCKNQIQSLKEENNRFKDFTGKSASELEIVTRKALALEENYMCQTEQIKALRHQLDAANHRVQMAETTMDLQRKDGAEHIRKVEELQNRLVEAEQQLNDGEILRRKLHNTIQELKGNIRVFCRVRPLLPEDEDSGTEPAVVDYPQSTELLGRGIELVQMQGQKYSFSFDKVFGPDIMQENVFEEISQLVQSALDGYKVCIFAYGQTGSGKTYTMLGQPDQSSHKGLIPRSLEQIFKSGQVLHSQGWAFKMQASMLEIYNETIRDLLSPKTISSDAVRMDSGAPTKVYNIKHDSTGNTFVSDLTVVEVTSWKEVSTLLQHAAQSRTVGKTGMNEQSSRSHCVFTLRISGINESTEQQVHGVLNLVDLAGSERLSRSGATGERLKETQAINKSLSSLGDVILAIGNKEQHIPYRNSKLTYLLQPCLGGDSKTLMFVNISPDPKSFNESLCSLRFAAKVNACEIGVPRRQTYTRGNEARLSTS